MPGQHTDRVVIIAGASRGIGAALVEAYSKIGYRVSQLAHYRRPRPPEIITRAVDIADPAVAERIVDLAV